MSDMINSSPSFATTIALSSPCPPPVRLPVHSHPHSFPFPSAALHPRQQMLYVALHEHQPQPAQTAATVMSVIRRSNIHRHTKCPTHTRPYLTFLPISLPLPQLPPIRPLICMTVEPCILIAMYSIVHRPARCDTLASFRTQNSHPSSLPYQSALSQYRLHLFTSPRSKTQ